MKGIESFVRYSGGSSRVIWAVSRVALEVREGIGSFVGSQAARGMYECFRGQKCGKRHSPP
jgi:hypothetical protein